MASGGRDGAATLEVLQRSFACEAAVAEALSAAAHEAAIERGTVIWPLQGEDVTSLVLKGRAQEVAYGREGGMLLLNIISVGDLYGALLSVGSDDAALIEATEDGRAAHFSGAALERMMGSYTSVALAVTRQLALRLAAVRRRMVETTLLSATGRVCSELLRRSAASADRTIRPVPVMSELAVAVQSTRETVSRTVSQLERRGILKRVDGGLAIVAPHRLEEQVY